MAKNGSGKSQLAGRGSAAAPAKVKAVTQKSAARNPRAAATPPAVNNPAPQGKRLVSEKAERFTESVIREMTRQAQLRGAMNLAQGFPDFPAPAELKRAAQHAIENDINVEIRFDLPQQ